MTTGKRYEYWNWWAEHLALTANVNRSKKSKPLSAERLHPYRSRKRRKIKAFDALNDAMRAHHGDYFDQEHRQELRQDHHREPRSDPK